LKHYTFEDAAVRVAGCSAAREFLQPIFVDRDRELLVVGLCDDALRLTKLMTIPGQEAFVSFSVATFAKDAVGSECTGFIMAHNHPSGDCRPSWEDRQLTKRVLLVAEALDITFLDHLIFSGDSFFSFRERGLI
jgi:DNA repair protein RadC